MGLPLALVTYTGDPTSLNLTVNWGDGNVEAGRLVTATNGETISNTHHYSDNGVYTVTLTFYDSFGSTAQASTKVTVLNVAPTSTVSPLPATENTTAFTLSWSGTDDPGGSGIASYDVYVSDNGGAFTPFLTRHDPDLGHLHGR